MCAWPQCCLRKIVSRSANCPNLATSKLLMAFKFPLDTNANLALVAPISPNKTELDMWGSARRKRIFQAADTSSRHIVSLSSWLQSGHRKTRTSEPPPGKGTTALSCISALQRQSGNSVEPDSRMRSNFDMTAPPKLIARPFEASCGE